MKPLKEYFKMVLLYLFRIKISHLSLWAKSDGVTIKMKLLQQYFHMVPFFSMKL